MYRQRCIGCGSTQVKDNLITHKKECNLFKKKALYPHHFERNPYPLPRSNSEFAGYAMDDAMDSYDYQESHMDDYPDEGY